MTVRFVPVFAASLLMASIASAQSAGPAPAETAVSPAAPRAVVPSTADTSKDYRIGPEDVLDIWVLDQRDLTRTIPVRPDGKISLPYVNDVMAAGKTPSELTAILTEGLTGPLKTPVVAVMVKEVRSSTASVFGAVKMPNAYPLRGGDTVTEMISRAQGFTDFADRKNILFIRKANGERITINIERVLDGKQPDYVVLAGDTIYVND